MYPHDSRARYQEACRTLGHRLRGPCLASSGPTGQRTGAASSDGPTKRKAHHADVLPAAGAPCGGDRSRLPSASVSFTEAIENVGKCVDAAGVATIVVGIVVATVMLLPRWPPGEEGYRRYRQRLGRAILLGLELLVAADIIRTVAVTPTFESAGVLAVIVLIRTFLSFSLEVELEGRWPWSMRSDTKRDGEAPGEASP